MGESTSATFICRSCGKQTDMTFHGNCRACEIEAHDYDEAVDDRDADEYEDCGLMPNGQCTRAGSEECDWECGMLYR